MQRAVEGTFLGRPYRLVERTQPNGEDDGK